MTEVVKCSVRAHAHDHTSVFLARHIPRSPASSILHKDTPLVVIARTCFRLLRRVFIQRREGCRFYKLFIKYGFNRYICESMIPYRKPVSMRLYLYGPGEP